MGAHIQNGDTDSYMDAVLELVTQRVGDLDKYIPDSFQKEG